METRFAGKRNSIVRVRVDAKAKGQAGRQAGPTNCANTGAIVIFMTLLSGFLPNRQHHNTTQCAPYIALVTMCPVLSQPEVNTRIFCRLGLSTFIGPSADSIVLCLVLYIIESVVDWVGTAWSRHHVDSRHIVSS